jgi:uncharacterized protein (TIGR00297 family)
MSHFAMINVLDGYNPWLLALMVNGFLAAIAVVLPQKLLTPWGYVHGVALGIGIWGTLGWRGYAIVMAYFLLGSGVTRLGLKRKEALGIAEKRAGQRGPENVWGSAATGLLCALLTLGANQFWQPLLLLAYVASFSTKLADTTASEVGKAYGNRTFLITTWQPVPKGTEGAVSLSGTLAGVAGSFILPLLAWGLALIDLGGVLICIIAAFMATNLESLIGATLQNRWSWLSNEVVNGINTLIGALVALGLGYWLAL